MQHWVVNGSGGQLGRCLSARLAACGETDVTQLDRSRLDLSDPAAVDAWFDRARAESIDVFANVAAYTAVDLAESEETLAERVNGAAPTRIAERCAQAGIRLVHVSTDYVFDGTATTPYAPDAPTGPVTAYGRTKLAGERGVLGAAPDALLVRTSWVFGPGKNFVLAMLRQAELRRSGDVEGPIRVVDDQRGCPTYADDLAQGMLDLVAAGAHGIFHLTNRGDITWRDFARAILDESGYRDLAIDPIATAALSLPARRPPYSVLDCSRAAGLGVELRDWRAALVDYLSTLAPVAAGAA